MSLLDSSRRTTAERVRLMLEYRRFPARTACYFLLLSPAFAYLIFIVKELVFGTLPVIGTSSNTYYLGVASGSGALSLLFAGVVVDRIKRLEVLLVPAAITTPIIGAVGYITGSSGQFNESYTEPLVISAFVCLVFFLLAWVLFLNKTVVVRFRGRITGAFLFISLILVVIFTLPGTSHLLPEPISYTAPELFSIVCIVVSVTLAPWRWKKYPLAVHGPPTKFFVPMVLILTSHILWFFGTKVDMINLHQHTFISLTQWVQSNLGITIAVYEPALLALGALVAGILADIQGRKTTFNFAILLMGLLAIFSPTMESTLDALPLLIMERFVEGYILGIGVFLIWNELGSAGTKARRLSLVWFFYLGYALLFFAFDRNLFFTMEEALQGQIGNLGGPFAIVVALIALYLSSHTPQIVGREVEMEKLSLDFDARTVKATVDAFVGEEDFTSIRSQLDILDGAQEISDSEFGEIIGEDFENALPLRRIPGIGPKLEEKFTDAGYRSAAQIAGETASRLASKVEGLTQDRAEKIIKDARSVVKKSMKQKKRSK
jgi:hypothetical protein